MSLPAYSHYPDYIVSNPSHFVFLVLINRPSRLNTFTDRMWHHLGTLFTQLSHDSSVRAVVLAGCGDNLTAGLDMHDASQGNILNGTTEDGVDGARKAVRILRYIEEFQECVSAVEKCEKRRFFLIVYLICTVPSLSYSLPPSLSFFLGLSPFLPPPLVRTQVCKSRNVANPRNDNKDNKNKKDH